VIGNLVTSSLFVSFSNTWIPSHRERMKTIALCENVINLHSTVIGEEVHWTEFGAFKFSVPSN